MFATTRKFLDHVSIITVASYTFLAKEELYQADLYEYAGMVLWNLPSRLDVYLHPNFDAVQDTLISFSTQLLCIPLQVPCSRSVIIGFTRLKTELPVLQSLYQTSSDSIFLDMILQIVIIILIMLSILLIYSLLSITVDAQYEEEE